MTLEDSAGDLPASPFARIPSVDAGGLLGSILELKNRPIGFLVDAFHRYGSIFRVHFGPSSMIFVAGALARKTLLSPSGCPFHREGLFRPFSSEVGIDVFDAEGEAHRRVRALITLPYSRQVTTQFVPEMDRAARSIVEAWTPGQRVDLFEAAYRMALHAMMKAVTPIDLRGQEENLTQAGNRVMYAQFGLFPEFTLKDPGYVRVRREVARAIDDAIERHRGGEFADHAKSHLVDVCLRATNDAGDRMDTKAIRGTCFYALAGTQIYIGRMVGFIVFELLKNRGYLARVLAEIDATAPLGELSRAFRRMPCLRAAYFEALRCYPLIPGYSYLTGDDFELGGFPIPRGEKVTFAPYLAHFSHENYPNPMAYDPERHLPPRREIARTDAFSPFGVGQHACAAQGLVETVTLTLLISLLRGVELDLERPSYQMDVGLRPLIAPKDPVWVRVRGRRVPATPSASALSEADDFSDVLGVGAARGQLPAKDPESIAQGQWLTRQDEAADAFFILLEGKVSIWKGKPEVQTSGLEAGSAFGDEALLAGGRRAFGVRVEARGRVLRFSRGDFERLVSTYDLTAEDIRALYYRKYVESLLRSSLPGVTAAFAPESLKWRVFAAGEFVYHQGEPSDALFIVVEGEAEALVETDEGLRTLSYTGPGGFFGAMGILKSHPRGSSIRAITPLKTLCITREEFLQKVSHSDEALSDLAITVCRRVLADLRAQAGKDDAPPTSRVPQNWRTRR